MAATNHEAMVYIVASDDLHAPREFVLVCSCGIKLSRPRKSMSVDAANQMVAWHRTKVNHDAEMVWVRDGGIWPDNWVKVGEDGQGNSLHVAPAGTPPSSFERLPGSLIDHEALRTVGSEEEWRMAINDAIALLDQRFLTILKNLNRSSVYLAPKNPNQEK